MIRKLSAVLAILLFLCAVYGMAWYGNSTKERIRQEGRDAAIENVKAEDCPYLEKRFTEAAGLWLTGWAEQKHKGE